MVLKALGEIMTLKQKAVSFRYKDRAGEWHWLETRATNMLDDPSINGIVTNSRDITESRNSLIRIQTQNQILREIAWDQSHIVRAPVARILGLLNEMTEEQPASQENCFVKQLRDSAEELDSIIRDIVAKTEDVGK